MKKFEYIFFSLFLGLIVLSSIQCSLIDPDDFSTISLVEEEQEVFETSVESADTSVEPFYFYSINLGIDIQSRKQKYFLYNEKDQSRIHLTVPYSPPELS